ncbi:bifunctional precorrin-2 dehydrogenase/sirohydrochlorin ferrochelatase [Peptococcus simiae]|uniref:precorrin-2 dehydrogenase/sirohydrochlorin ferrochelatase family protein n=1 Tax=Peptococcus simiae TaxID=1643805 RepID=UPI00398126CC
MSFNYVIHCDLAAANCLIVGGGRVALRKVQTLLETGAQVTVVAPDFLSDLAGIQHEQLHCIKRPFVMDDLANRDLVFVATNDRGLNEEIAAACRDRHIPVNVADSRLESSFIVPALLQKEDLLISIATNGKNPGYSRALKAYLNDQIDDSFLEALDIWCAVRDRVKEEVQGQTEREKLLRQLSLADLIKAMEAGSKEDVYRRVIECLLL